MILTDRLQLHPLRPEHADLLFSDLQDPRIYTWIPDEPPASREALRARYTRMVAGLPPERAEQWLNWVVARVGDGQPLGLLQATVLPLERRAEVAYVLFPSAWGHGYATEAVRWLLDHLREAHGIAWASADIDTRNRP